MSPRARACQQQPAREYRKKPARLRDRHNLAAGDDKVVQDRVARHRLEAGAAAAQADEEGVGVPGGKDRVIQQVGPRAVAKAQAVEIGVPGDEKRPGGGAAEVGVPAGLDIIGPPKPSPPARPRPVSPIA